MKNTTRQTNAKKAKAARKERAAGAFTPAKIKRADELEKRIKKVVRRAKRLEREADAAGKHTLLPGYDIVRIDTTRLRFSGAVKIG